MVPAFSSDLRSAMRCRDAFLWLFSSVAPARPLDSLDRRAGCGSKQKAAIRVQPSKIGPRPILKELLVNEMEQ
jgi:hypothetical protein